MEDQLLVLFFATSSVLAQWGVRAQNFNNSSDRFDCQDGSEISALNKCNGIPNCPNGSDETLRTCKGFICEQFRFRCAYGACVHQNRTCDGKNDCVDGSDEAKDHYGDRIRKKPRPMRKFSRPTNSTNSTLTTTTIESTTTIFDWLTTTPFQSEKCVLPSYPDHGSFSSNFPGAKPGDKYEFITLKFTCEEGYGIQGVADMYCLDGIWQHDFPKCVRVCQLNTNSPGVKYWCEIPNTNGGTRSCRPFEPSGTIVYPNCKTPNYYSPNELPIMSCIDGHWNYAAYCIPECGTVTPKAEKLIINGMSAEHGELPWHVGIYSKNYEPYMQICGGSIVSSTLVISAAHCFWDDNSQAPFPASQYAVGAGKVYRSWNEPNDKSAQTTDVRSLKIPGTFLGEERNFADDIALVFVSQTFIFKPFIRPVCLSFNEQFEKTQLFDGNIGKVAGWGLTDPNSNASPLTLRVVELPFINSETCILKTPVGYREHITSEKFCAGYDNGTALCKGDSGGGLVFPSQDQGVIRYYLRGVVLTAPKSFDLCNAAAITSFTQISKQYSFIRRHHSSH